MRSLLALFFRLLYHPFAWTYDLVSNVVSLGRWQDWLRCVLPYLEGRRLLEIGFGPGHLQEELSHRDSLVFGLDESRQMVTLARRRLCRLSAPLRLTRGLAGSLPFPKNCFDCITATFPSEYIFEAETLREIQRVLVPGGKLVIAPCSWITGQGIFERAAAWLFRVTGQAGAIEAVLPRVKNRLAKFGFEVSHTLVELPGSRVLVVLAKKEA